MIIYLAGPLFTVAERRFNAEISAALQERVKGAEVILPQQKAAEISHEPEFLRIMCDYCLGAIEGCDCVVAILDGADADSGTCVECGYAYARGKPIVGVRTDSRASEDRGLNLMVAGICQFLVLNLEVNADARGIAAEITRVLQSIVPARD
jgi:nucleoside 2-deoxyribosyltransferase